MIRKIVLSNFIVLVYLSNCLGNNGVTKYDSNCKTTLYDVNIPSIKEFRELVDKFMEKGMKVIQNSDPFSSNHIDLKVNAYGVQSEGYLDDLLVSGTSSTNLNEVHIDDSKSLQVALNISLRHLQCLCSYQLNFDLLTMFPIYGKGDFGIAVSDIQIAMQATIKQLLDKRLQMTNCQLSLNMGDTKVDLSSLFNSTYRGVYFSELLSDVIPLVINEFPPLKTYGGMGLRAMLNTLMCNQGITLDVIIDFMQNFIK